MDIYIYHMNTFPSTWVTERPLFGMKIRWKKNCFGGVSKLISVRRNLMRNDSEDDVPYCDYGCDSDAARYDGSALTGSASLSHRENSFCANLGNLCSLTGNLIFFSLSEKLRDTMETYRKVTACLVLYSGCVRSTVVARASLTLFEIGHYLEFSCFVRGKWMRDWVVSSLLREVISLCNARLECTTARPKQIVDDVCSQA